VKLRIAHRETQSRDAIRNDEVKTVPPERPQTRSESEPLAAPDSELTVSVVICAYTEQRWDDVLAAVRSVFEQRYPVLETILVVDHNPQLLKGLESALPQVTVTPNLHSHGLSGGKNTGVELAQGDIVAFLDDDATAESDWIGAMIRGYTSSQIAGVGGTTKPRWETARPGWFPEEFDWVVGATFVGREPGVVRNLLGGNASFRRSIFDRVGGFPTGMGRNSTNSRPLGAEETEFCIRVSQRMPGSIFVYESDAVIHHWAPIARERFSYFRSRCYAEGLSKAAMIRSVGARPGLSTESRYVSRILVRGIARGIRQSVTGDRGGFLRAGAIVIGLASTVGGFGVGFVATGVRRVRGK
jgi:glycosyltransferase involved in cell wall biosynthesis